MISPAEYGMSDEGCLCHVCCFYITEEGQSVSKAPLRYTGNSLSVLSVFSFSCCSLLGSASQAASFAIRSSSSLTYTTTGVCTRQQTLQDQMECYSTLDHFANCRQVLAEASHDFAVARQSSSQSGTVWQFAERIQVNPEHF